MNEKITLLAIGTIVTVAVGVVSFLAMSFFGSFVTQAQYNEGQATIQVIEVKLDNLKEGQEEIKGLLEGRNGTSKSSN